MPSSYTPPDVVVTQRQRTLSAPRITPPLPVVVVGPSAQIVSRANAGLYSAGNDFQVGLPGLTTGAIVDENTLDVLLDAKSSLTGASLGLFRLQKDIDYAVVYDANGLPASIKVYGNLGLEYSLISSRNNNADTISADTSTGSPDGLWFTDNSLDFVSRGVDTSGDCVIVVSSPTNLAGRYAVRDLITGVGSLATTSHEVRAEAVDTNGVAIVRKSWTGINAGVSTNEFIGFCTNHVRGVHFSEVNNVSADTLNGVAETPSSSIFGIGIAQAPKVSLVTADFNAIIAPGLVLGATPSLLPGQASSAAVWFTPFAGTPNQGPNAPKWIAIMAAAKVGNWFRIKLAAGTEVRDFKILSVDFKNQQILLQNPDGDLTDSSTYQPINNGITEAYLLEVFRGSSDETNACGDYVLLGATYFEIYRATPYRIEFTQLVSFGASATAVASRGFAFRNVSAAYDLKKSITSGFGGNVYASYTGARVDLAEQGLITISSEDDIEQFLGPIHKDNPLALAAAMVNQAGGTAGGRVFFALSTNGTGPQAYQEAFDLLQTTEDVYFIVPLSQDKAIHQALAAHVELMSQPEMKGERYGLICPSFPAPVQVLPPNSTDPPVVGTVDALDATKMKSVAVDWTLAAVGNLVWVVDQATGNKLASYRIKSIDIPNSTVSVFNAFPTTGATVYFIVETYTLTPTEEAVSIRDYAAAFGSKRMGCMVPDQIKLTYTNKTLPVPQDETWLLPGYYAAAAFAGFRSNSDPSAPMTNIAVPGVQELVHSNTYFLPDQLNTIAEGGNIILVQRTKSTPCFVRHQLNTDMSAIETREMSITVAVDYCAKVMRIGLRPYIGKHNITDELLTQLRGIAESLLKALVDGFVVRQGSTLERLEQNTDRPDEVDLDISLVVFYPCNRINVTLYI
ncbi:MAG: hypothetical protein WC869_00315 [Phycisphaerae bacterium]|jgi:hypothetical protein